ncbi:MAG: flagellin, partial [Lawsonibacter sp.]|nr:flagellin [Lawsonibacter sp.]
MRIQHNIPAMSSYRNYTRNTNALSKNLEKLSSGYKINRAGDDAAGLAISEKMRAQIT